MPMSASQRSFGPQPDAAFLSDFAVLMSRGKFAWKGGASCRFAFIDNKILFIELGSLTTQRSKLRALVRDTLVDNGWRKAARFDGYDVAILLTVDNISRRIDADNVAKALLDALTGLVWQDDRQIRRLVVEKEVGSGPAITLRAMPYEGGSLQKQFARHLAV